MKLDAKHKMSKISQNLLFQTLKVNFRITEYSESLKEVVKVFDNLLK